VNGVRDLVMLDPLVHFLEIVERCKGGAVDRHNVDDVGEEEASHFVRVCKTHARGDLACTEHEFLIFSFKYYMDIHTAAINGNINTTRRILNSGINVNSRGNLGFTALQAAAERGHTALVQLLLDRGANINARDQNGFTALMDAAGEGHLATVRLLLERGAYVNARSPRGGWTALKCAAEASHPATIRLLLAHGAKPVYNINNNNMKKLIAVNTISKYRENSRKRHLASVRAPIGNLLQVVMNPNRVKRVANQHKMTMKNYLKSLN